MLLQHIKQAVHAAHTYHAKGLLITEWGDNGHLQQRSFQIPPIVLAGVLSWNKDAESSLDVKILLASVLNMVPSLVSSDRVFNFVNIALFPTCY